MEETINLTGILKSQDIKRHINNALNTDTPVEISGVCEPLRHFLCAGFFYESKKRLFITVPDEKEADSLKDKLCGSGIRAMVFPSRDFLLDNIKSYSKEWEQQRIAVIFALLRNECDCVITVPDGAMQYTIPKDIASGLAVDLKIGDTIEQKELIKKLSEMGYKRAETVEGAGQFAARGSIIDVFSPQYDRPCRMDFFDNELDSMGSFDVLSQRRSENMQFLSILPVSEILISKEAKERISDAVSALISSAQDSATAELLKSERISLTESGTGPIDKYYSLIYENKSTVFDYIGEHISLVIDTKRVTDRARSFAWQFDETVMSLAQKGQISFKNSEPTIKQGDLIQKLRKNCVGINIFTDKTGSFEFALSEDIGSKRIPPAGEYSAELCERAKEYRDKGKNVFIAVSSDRALNSLSALFADHGIKTYRYKERVYKDNIGLISDAMISAGGSFELPDTVLISETENGVRSVPKKKKINQSDGKYKGEKIASYADLSIGDLVVHVNHGIGRYVGIDQLKFEGAVRDYIKLEYRDGDNLYVPCDQLDRISKYVGSESVKLTRLSSNEWQKAKIKAKAAASNIAKGLIKLYSERRLHRAFPFPADDEYQKEFEDAFGFAETPGQLSATEEIKHDMESDVPMDRLLCGDVGFGKTEVALRAVFKCVCAGKQAAILVPTTILAWQHYQTMLQRFRTFPVTVQMLSRFRDKTAQEAILKDLKSGKIDVIVGTHKLLQDYIGFKDLGLLVIDEEQRFGVTHKEKLKELSKNVHVLTLSATPIPRTLNMALTGIRDLSVLEEAPEGRLPVQSFVIEHDDVLINEAIRRELRRGGQVFYLHNFIESIYKRAEMLSKEFPDHTVAVAHGQMSRDELSKVWEAMVKKEIDVLVCTTIIETGIDVPNANTLIIEDSNKLGLSQLHQIRGRVGRSSRKAYA